MLCCVIAVFLLYRNIQSVTRFSALLWLGVMGTMMTVIVTGLLRFHPSLALGSRRGVSAVGRILYRAGRGAADCHLRYWGAYNINFLGGEVRDPGRIIPLAIVWSVGLVAALYLLLNTSVLGSMPWQELVGQAGRGPTLRSRGGGRARLWRGGRTDRRTAGGVDRVRFGLCASAGLFPSAVCRRARR